MEKWRWLQTGRNGGYGGDEGNGEGNMGVGLGFASLG